MTSRWFGLVAALLLLPSLAGCVTGEGSLGGRCDAWTLEDDPAGGVETHIHVKSSRSPSACVEVRLGGPLAAQVPLEIPPQGDAAHDSGRSLEWNDPRLTVRAEETLSGDWESQALDLDETPHVVVTVTEATLYVNGSTEAPAWS